MDRRFGELQETIRKNHTELLRAFLAFQDTVNIRFKNLEVNAANNDRAVKARMEYLERRLAQIEKKLLLEPPAA